MRIDKAIKHLNWRFKKSWKPTKLDVEAYNSIIDYVEIQEQKTLSENESFAKLWIYIFINRSSIGYSNAYDIIKFIDSILERSVFDLVKALQSEILTSRIQSVGIHKHPPLRDLEFLNIDKRRDRDQKIIKDFSTDILKVLHKEVSQEQTIKFVNSQVNRVINKFEK